MNTVIWRYSSSSEEDEQNTALSGHAASYDEYFERHYATVKNIFLLGVAAYRAHPDDPCIRKALNPDTYDLYPTSTR